MLPAKMAHIVCLFVLRFYGKNCLELIISYIIFPQERKCNCTYDCFLVVFFKERKISLKTTFLLDFKKKNV